ncbi:low-density lipoprotein receptor-related protein 3-like [Antedon mediterranea]|uniref:low-density lipoprotein receptor-related protein 3-like n=1 Tax=Antedon mediterranea TaxID=105859 RepID=UPI003AF54A59
MALGLSHKNNLNTWLSWLMSISHLVVLFATFTEGIDVDYLTTNCNNTITAQKGGIIEPESRLFYSNNVDCISSLKAPEGSQLLLQFYRFSLEDYVNNQCADKLVVYDGLAPNSSRRLTEELCGRIRPENVESTGESVTIEFVSDEDGQSTGFGIFYTIFRDAPCSEDEFECDNGKCIAASLKCDTYDMCGDNSDEANCDEPAVDDRGLSTAVIFAILVGSICFVIAVIYIVYTVKEKQRQKKLTEQILKESVLKPSDNNYCDKDFWGSS